MRMILAFAFVMMLGGAAPVDYTRTVVVTPEGGYRMGNPAAKVKLVEYLSLTCPHCREFHIAANTTLRRDYIARGLVSYEVRNYVLNGADLAASALSRCRGQGAFYPSLDIFLRQQPTWTEPFVNLSDADSARIAALPEDKQLAAFAIAGKLDTFVAAHGLPRAAFNACLADSAAIARLTKIGQDASARLGVKGTPTFLLNGKIVETNTWTTIEPRLRSALGFKPRT